MRGTPEERPIAALMLASHRVKRAIKQDPRLWRAFKQLRSALGPGSGSAIGPDGRSSHGGQTGESGAAKPE
jgi:hypothetical protein